MNTENLFSFKQLYRTTKSLKYGPYLVTMFPVFALLFYNGLINSPWSVAYIIPFIPAFAAGFMYNTVCDAKMDPAEKNPITSGAISKRLVLTSAVILFLVSILLLLLIYSSETAWLLFLVLIFLWFSYSGLKLRFKESILGPIIASIGFFVLPPAILLSEFNFFSFESIMLILGIFLIYLGHEIRHTVLDYESDLSFNCKTFAVILGKKNSTLIEYITLIMGYAFLLVSIYYFIPDLYLTLLFTIVFIACAVSTIIYGIQRNFDITEDVVLNTIPYTVTRIALVVLGLLILNLPIVLILFIIWILL